MQENALEASTVSLLSARHIVGLGENDHTDAPSQTKPGEVCEAGSSGDGRPRPKPTRHGQHLPVGPHSEVIEVIELSEWMVRDGESLEKGRAVRQQIRTGTRRT
ncbi:hypothetical protein H310_05968 [Aphanomyces invadans]|uniref:Uncharacterized protein n=1 Tax=Aphanomyces invadans TaxID=157072 RepID=A0A024U882_9STRA|nr:hypothetical protein H310_05968 [Aphanomyces invadans]ETW02459.1 hypothetical protein H310_05968 [Aphanomyces invadans]|eukprot:XP_008869064.1 hypothetical protein H310_05968 [Aphanomyces invadans]